MHIFMSAGEPSGDLHAGNLARELLRKDPTLRLAGFGGEPGGVQSARRTER